MVKYSPPGLFDLCVSCLSDYIFRGGEANLTGFFPWGF